MFNQIMTSSSYSYNPHAVPVLAAGILIFMIGVFILLQTKKTVKNIAFFLFCMSLSLWLIPSSIVYLAKSPDIALWWYKRFVFLGVVTIMPNFYLFSVATVGVLQKRIKSVVAGYLAASIAYVLVVTTNTLITTPVFYAWGYYPHYELPAMLLFFVPYAILFFASEVNLWIAYKKETVAIKRQHILTIFVGLLIGFLASFDFVAKLSTYPLYPFGFIPSFILSAMVAYSVIRHKAFDIETVVHKTIMWIASFSIIALPVFLAYRWAMPMIEDSTLGQFLFGIFSFMVVVLYLRIIQPHIDHIFQRRKADLEEMSSQFAGDLVHLEGIENLTRRLEEAVVNALYPQWMDIFLYNEKKKNFCVVNQLKEQGRATSMDRNHKFLEWLQLNNRIVYGKYLEIDPEYASVKEVGREYFESTGAMVVIPLVLNEKLLGIVHLAKKANLSRYNAVDFQFLTTVKNQSAIAISNSLMYQNIEEQVKERTHELVEVQKQLIQAEKLATVGTLSGGVAHEINNPLTAILTNVQMLLMSADDGKVDKESLQMIEEATQRCRTIVQKMMTYAKKPAEASEAVKTDLVDVLDKTISFIRYQLEQDGIQIEVNVEGGSCFVLGNQNELEQVLTNLILNARDATLLAGSSGTIYITLSKAAGRVQVKIEDKGVGMVDEIKNKIFDPFFTTKDIGKGLGLGLSICHSIVEKCEGEILVESAPGKGSVFTLQIPEYIH